jgi:hypothetical protein
MKKVIILICLVTWSTLAIAQQGSWYIGGLVGFGVSSNEAAGSNVKTKTTSWALSPEIGTFLKDDIQLGAVLGFGGSKDDVDGNDVEKTSTISPTIYGRKFFSITENFSTFAGIYLNLISEKETDYGPTEETKASGFGARLGVGVAYALSPKFTAVGQYGLLGFSSVKNKVDGTEVSTDTDFGFGVNTVGGSVFNVGLYYTFKQ